MPHGTVVYFVPYKDDRQLGKDVKRLADQYSLLVSNVGFLTNRGELWVEYDHNRGRRVSRTVNYGPIIPNGSLSGLVIGALKEAQIVFVHDTKGTSGLVDRVGELLSQSQEKLRIEKVY